VGAEWKAYSTLWTLYDILVLKPLAENARLARKLALTLSLGGTMRPGVFVVENC
jgi:hypothetical protein